MVTMMECISEHFRSPQLPSDGTENNFAMGHSAGMASLEEAYANQNRVYVRWKLITQKPVTPAREKTKTVSSRTHFLTKLFSFF